MDWRAAVAAAYLGGMIAKGKWKAPYRMQLVDKGDALGQQERQALDQRNL